MNQNPQQVLSELELRAVAIGHSPNETIYRLCIEDVLSVLAAKLAKNSVPVKELSDEELGNFLERAQKYIEGEGMPWHDIASQGISDAWPERLPSKQCVSCKATFSKTGVDGKCPVCQGEWVHGLIDDDEDYAEER